MATINSVIAWNYYGSAKHTYTGTQVGAYNNSYCERIYSFTVRETGARQVAIVLTYTSVAGNSNNIYCTVNQTEDMYTESTAGLSTDGVAATVNTSAKTLTFTIDVDLIGSGTYYAHIYAGASPASANVKFSTTDGVTITEEGSYGGMVSIDNGSSFDSYQIYIDNGSSWDMYQAYIDNGSSWDLMG